MPAGVLLHPGVGEDSIIYLRNIKCLIPGDTLRGPALDLTDTVPLPVSL